MPVHVFFFGLICHINDADTDGTETHAAVVNAPLHTARLWSHRDGADTFHPLTHDVTFAGLPAGAATTNEDFEELVPNLRHDRLTAGNLKGKVRRKEEDKANVHAYVIYPAGSQLLVSRRYPWKARYNNGEEPMCVAQIIRLQINADTVTVPHYNVVLDQQSPAMLIMNGSRDNTPGQPHNRFYERLLDGEVVRVDDIDASCEPIIEPVPQWILDRIKTESTPARLEERTAACVDDGLRAMKELIVTLRVECANTQWP